MTTALCRLIIYGAAHRYVPNEICIATNALRTRLKKGIEKMNYYRRKNAHRTREILCLDSLTQLTMLKEEQF